MTHETRLLTLVDSIYAAAEDPNRWSGALAHMAELLPVSGVNFIVNLGGARHDGIIANHGLDPALVQRYNDYYVTVDPLVPESYRAEPGEIVCSSVALPGGGWDRTELYADHMAPYGLHHIFGALLERDETCYAALSLMLAPGLEALEGDDLVAFKTVVPHLQRALAIHRRLSDAEGWANLLTGVADTLSVGLLLLDEVGRVVHANAAGRRIGNAGDGITFGRDGVVAADPRETEGLRRLVAEAIETGSGEGLASAGAMRVTRPSWKRPYEVLAAPLSSRQRQVLAQPAVAALFIADPEDEPDSPEGLLADLYGLTGAEARLAAALLRGETLDEISERFGVTLNTVRTQLRAIFGKTETSRQSELIRVLLRGPVGNLSGLPLPTLDS